MTPEFLKELERLSPGSVRVNEKTGVVTLIGWRSEQFIDAESDESKATNIKNNTCEPCIAPVSRNFCADSTSGIENKLFLVGMIDPFANTPENTTERNKCSCGCGISFKHSGAIKHEHEGTSSNQYLVPVVKSKFRQRVFHLISRLFLGG
ncbi:Uncharacterised protein [Yersinia enterocolitica]|nr:Uncharacterised protein [Yersinia enterocolitica]CRX55479.1 Uncharacterised protein [Yersinia enterocolitica]